jgi:hypothetical protein
VPKTHPPKLTTHPKFSFPLSATGIGPTVRLIELAGSQREPVGWLIGWLVGAGSRQVIIAREAQLWLGL